MRDIYTPSKKLQKSIDKINSAPLKVGQEVLVEQKEFSEYSTSKDHITCRVTEIHGENYTVEGMPYSKKQLITLHRDKIHPNKMYVGANPFPESPDRIRNINFSLESILFNLAIIEKRRESYDIKGITVNELTWNPYVYINGEKWYYQRPFVWELEDKQLLIESIYNGVDCGKILVRKHGFDELNEKAKLGETDLAFNDIIDGKQRLAAIRDFILGEFKDLHGNFYGDLCAWAKRGVINHQLLSYSELPERSTDKEVLSQFLKLNFSGKPQSKEHLDFVRDLHKKAV